jgi:patatin-related protein
LEKLLRDPLSKNPPSLLLGDDYFLPVVRDALARMLDQEAPEASPAGGSDRSVELILTSTLWRGRTSTFTDDMGAAITEVDHDARFRFALSPDRGSASSDLAPGELVDQLAVAARCTSSFPAAFEPHFVQVTDRTTIGEGPWNSEAGPANFRDSQYLVDGGILLNKPIRPALEAIYQQTGKFLVRRVLAYVVPHPGEPELEVEADTAQDRVVPQARDVLLGILTRLRSTDSVSRELTEIRTRNADARGRRRVRDRLAAAMIDASDQLASGAWSGYIEVRIAHAARTIGRLLAAGQENPSGRWSERDLTAALQRLLRARVDQATDPFFIPQGDLQAALQRADAEWDWGATTVTRLGDMTVDVLKRAVWLAPMSSGWQQAIVKTREDISHTLDNIRADRRSLDAYWSTAPAGRTAAGTIPSRLADALDSATNTDELERWLDKVLEGWELIPAPDMGAGGRRQSLYTQALDLAEHLRSCADAIAVVSRADHRHSGAKQLSDEQRQVLSRAQNAVDPEGLERQRLKALYDYLLAPARARRARLPKSEEVLVRMLKLDVVQLAFSGASQEVEQEVELVQVSARHPAQLTGIQLHHFGAFYRPSWRMNDWLHGRMDGAAHLVRLLLSTERLRQLAAAMASASRSTAGVTKPAASDLLLEAIHQCAISSRDPADSGWLQEQWAKVERPCRRFVELILTPRPARPQLPPRQDQPPSTADPAARERELLETCTRTILRSIQTRILREDLGALADAIRSEGADCPDASQAWLAAYDASIAAKAGTLATEQLWALWEQAEQIGKEQLTAEIGSDTLARTASQAAAVAASTVGAPSKPKAVAVALSALRGYTLAVWAMVTLLTRKSHFGPRVVQLAVAAGGVLLAAAIFVPAMPWDSPSPGSCSCWPGSRLEACSLRRPGASVGASASARSSLPRHWLGTPTGSGTATAGAEAYGVWRSR